MIEQISPAHSIHGAISVPGDKSISHRFAMLTSIAEGSSQILNYSTGADCRSTLLCMEKLGVRYEFGEREERPLLTVHGRGLRSLRQSASFLDAGNSGSTMRMLSGILAAQAFTTEISGDGSLVKRPMRRILAPLREMGARIDALNDQFPPLTIHGSPLSAIDYTLPVASAQVKSCLLLAGLYANGETSVRESVATRDHTELALSELGADITIEPRHVRVRAGAPLTAKNLIVPGDISSAAFFIVAALLVRDSDLVITNVGLNPTRTMLLDVLGGMGANIRVLHIEQVNGELIGNLQIKSSRVRGGVIEGSTTAAVIDEIPILSVLGAVSQDGLMIRDAGELRVKETDRIDAIANNLQRMGVNVHTTNDSIEIPGRQSLHHAELDSFDDHRIAMAFSVAALLASDSSTMQNAGCASISFPEFYSTLRQIAQ
ncbi:MAG: 3-phosphoshikimate 1-carboxyvinyltransferase [Bryobacteraceae bacterium]